MGTCGTAAGPGPPTQALYLGIVSGLHHREPVVIGRRVAENIHDDAHFLPPPQAGDRRAHHLPVEEHTVGPLLATGSQTMCPWGFLNGVSSQQK